jgi:hypothetical protein
MKDFTPWVLKNIEMAERIYRETKLRHMKLQLPFKVKTFQIEFDVNARNEKEESLTIGVVRYLDNAKRQVLHERTKKFNKAERIA